jgi:hypothetical protein
VGELASTADWHLDVPFDLSLNEYLELKCDRIADPGLKLIAPVIKQMPEVLIYHACAGNVFTASKRDCLGVTEPVQDEVDKFLDWYHTVIFPQEIEPLLQNFEYSYEMWYNHLSYAQQQRIDACDKNHLDKRNYTNFCKKEKQIIEGDKYPKNRCICGPNEEYKFVVGPVIHRLEQIFKQHFKGYTSGLNWTRKEQILNQCRNNDRRFVIEGDGSGFDRTQYLCLKEVEFTIYRWLVEHGKIHHVDPEIFLKQSTQGTVKIQVKYVEKLGPKGIIQKLGFYNKTGCTQSGNMDTTFANTLRQCMYNRYTIEYHAGIHKSTYDLQTAGDDFTVELPTCVERQRVLEAYAKVFTTNKTGKHGLGQVMKFMKFTDLDGIDFCSTETYYEPGQGYKIIRQIPRFLTLTCWSQTALGMTPTEQRQYMLDLYEANKLWIGDLPILSQYNELFRVFANRIPVGNTKIKQGKKKRILSASPYMQQLYADCDNFSQYEAKFGTDDAYAMHVRISEKSGQHTGFYDMLSDRYGLTRVEVDHICEKLVEHQKLDIDIPIDIPELEIMCSHRAVRFDAVKESDSFALRL